MIETIGRTPMIELRRVVPAGCARVLVKLEGHNPTGSMKDRMARSVIESAVSSGRLAAGGRVVELPSDGGRTTKELIQRMMAEAAGISRSPNSFFADQFNNPDAAGGYASLADEILEQAVGPVDALVQSVGTAQSKSCRSPPQRPRTWPGAWPGRRHCSPEHPPEPMSRRRSGLRNASAKEGPLSRLPATPA